MSRTPQVIANAKKGTEIRKAGFKTSIHANPDFREWFDREYREGKNVKHLYHRAVEIWGKENVPSKRAIDNYCARYLQPVGQTTEIRLQVPNVPKYIGQIEKFDAYLKMHDAAQEVWARYEGHREKERKMGGMVSQAGREEMKLYTDLLARMLDYEIKLGLRPVQQAPSITFNQTNLTGRGPSIDLGSYDEGTASSLDKLIEWRRELEQYKSARAESTDPDRDTDVSNGEYEPVHESSAGVQEQLAS